MTGPEQRHRLAPFTGNGCEEPGERAADARRQVEWHSGRLIDQYPMQIDALTRRLGWQRHRLRTSTASGSAPVLSLLTALRGLDEAVHHLIGQSVSVARRHGATWTQIGHALGISRQAAHERFAVGARTAPEVLVPGVGVSR